MVGSILHAVGGVLLALLRAFIRLLQKSRIATVAFVLIVVVGFGLLIDVGVNGGKAYPGVHIGTLDVSGKTEQEIIGMVNDTFQSRLDSTTVTIYASEQARADAQNIAEQAQNAALVEEVSVEEANANTDFWTTDAQTLGAALHPEDLAARAMEVGRSNGGVLARLSALFGSWTIEPTLEYNDDELEALAHQIDDSIGNPRVDFDVKIEQGEASVTEGHDGMMVDRDTFNRQVTDAFLLDDDPSFIAEAVYAPLRIDRDQAQAVCDQLNQVIDNGIQLSYQGSSWQLYPIEVGSILATRVQQDGDGWRLLPFVDDAQARALILTQAQQHHEGTVAQVTFSKADDGSITVLTDGKGTMPLATEGIQALDAVLFGGQDSVDVDPLSETDQAAGVTHAERDATGGLVTLMLAMTSTPASLSFDDALNAGVISAISSFTTEYSNAQGSENRNHNIHLVSDKLNNSIVEPDGTWSFNDTAGERTEEAGFKGAGQISAGEFTEGVGGGICQVATTVFNAVYNAGLPITERRNHSLYVASYPAGRDAAVSWPDLDLKWGNDTDSDILVRMTYDETSVTCTLYGVSPGYTVETEVGDWEEGEPYKTRVEVDDSLPTGTSYVETAGTDGKEISVVRTVTDSQGTVVRQDRFDSVYDPKNEVIVTGPDTEVDIEDRSSDDDDSDQASEE